VPITGLPVVGASMQVAPAACKLLTGPGAVRLQYNRNCGTPCCLYYRLLDRWRVLGSGFTPKHVKLCSVLQHTLTSFAVVA
jgi:hypothetical protein